MNVKHRQLAWLFQVIAVLILFPVGYLKLTGNPGDIFIFSKLEMEPFGRYLIGALEVIAALLLITEPFAAVGALLGTGLMCGAIIAHATTLGLVINEDGGLHFMLLVAVAASCILTMLLRRKQIPVIGKTL